MTASVFAGLRELQPKKRNAKAPIEKMTMHGLSMGDDRTRVADWAHLDDEGFVLGISGTRKKPGVGDFDDIHKGSKKATRVKRIKAFPEGAEPEYIRD